MKIPFTQIRNAIRKYETDSLLNFCHNYIEYRGEEIFQLWNVLLIMKWSYLHGSYSHPRKACTPEAFRKIYNYVYEFNNDHITDFLKAGKLEQGMQIFHSQQFYLQRAVYNHIFATQLKLYSDPKHFAEESFKQRTGVSIIDFLQITHLIWIVIETKKLPDNPLKYFGHVSQNVVNFLCEKFGGETIGNYFNITTLKSWNAKDRILNYKRGLLNPDLQIFEPSFFTINPFHEFNGQLKVIHKSIFKYYCNYFIYDFLKQNDPDFTTYFGNRFEKIIQESLSVVSPDIVNESQLKKILGSHSNLIDFYLREENIFIECKAIEIQTYPSINPTEDLLYSSLKDSILKAYYKQLLQVAQKLTREKEAWGIVLTYKEIFWSDFKKLNELCGKNYEPIDLSALTPENVFIIDISTWNLILHIIESGQATLLEILQLAKNNNSDPKTRKQLFSMHLDNFEIDTLKIEYLRSAMPTFEY